MTFSIVARDPQTGQLGVAVQSHWFSVGATVAWAEAGVGAVATQALAEVSYGPLGLSLMQGGKPAPAALAALLTSDEGMATRQVAMVDSAGRVAVHTGARCMDYAGHEMGEGFSCQANMMHNPTIWKAMAEAYRTAQGPLAERLVCALEAGQAAGGDIRGQQSAAILVVSGTSSRRPWVDRLVELRVEDHPQPIVELRRLVRIHNAYDYMSAGDGYLGNGQIELALAAYRTADAIAPEIAEIQFWHAVTLADMDRLAEALPIFKQVFLSSPNWAELLKRLPSAGMIKVNPETLQRILALL
jgi:uncharacterized Ntn-hydrolase superfamily protein